MHKVSVVHVLCNHEQVTSVQFEKKRKVFLIMESSGKETYDLVSCITFDSEVLMNEIGATK